MKQQFLSILFFLVSFFPAFSQPPDYSNDVETKEAIIHALYDVISGEVDKERDWARFRNLFLPESRLIPTGKNKQNEFTIRAITPEEYITMFTKNMRTGFFERELHQEVEEYGTIAHVFSTYETRESLEGPISNRGINSIQLYFNGNRYFVLNIFWCAESIGFPLPPQYLN